MQEQSSSGTIQRKVPKLWPLGQFGFDSRFRESCWPTLNLDLPTLEGNYDYKTICLATWYAVEMLQFWFSHLMKYGYKKWVTFLLGLENLLTLTITNKSEADAVNIHSALLVNTSPTRKRKP